MEAPKIKKQAFYPRVQRVSYAQCQYGCNSPRCLNYIFSALQTTMDQAKCCRDNADGERQNTNDQSVMYV